MESRYQTLESLGKGGMGEVFKVRDTQLNRIAAAKMLLPEMIEGEEARARFLREARLAAQLNHPNIATIYDIITSDDETVIIMEYVEGETLRERISRGPIPLPEMLDIAAQIAGALATAHARNVVHRDIKSENIKVRPDGRVKLLDFGLAKQVQSATVTGQDATRVDEAWVTQPGFTVGTPGYSAPEQWKGGQIDNRADIFSFGVVLYEMITGRFPFPGRTAVDRITATLHAEPEAVTVFTSVPPALSAMVSKALAKDPNHRYQSIVELATDLESLRHEPSEPEEQDTIRAGVAPTLGGGRYRITGELGEGGMGKVYRAEDLKLGRTVAIKELRQAILGDQGHRDRFLREARLLAQLNHRNIATIHDIVEDGDRILIVMEYIDGERLLDRIKREPCPSDVTQRFAREIADALAEAHRQDIIHRDIKSANIMITPGGHIKVLDFGLAKRLLRLTANESDQTQTMAAELTGTLITLGTPKYMSPEQRFTADVDGRSDIFSLGIVICEMLAGPFDYTGEVLAHIMETDATSWPAPLNRIPGPWHPVLRKSLARDPQARYQSATELIADLDQIGVESSRVLESAEAVKPESVAPVEIEGPRIGVSLGRSALALIPSLFFLHLTATTESSTDSLIYFVLTVLSPFLIYLLPQLMSQRATRMLRVVAGTHPGTLPLLVANLILILLTSVAVLDLLGLQSWGDWRYAINNEETHPDIVLVAIDEKTKNAFQEKGVSVRDASDLISLRRYHPQVLRAIAANRPRVIAFDLFFSDASEQSEDDRALATSLREVRSGGVPVILGKYFDEQAKQFLETTAIIRNALDDGTTFAWWGHPIVLSDRTRESVVRLVPIRIIQKEPLEAGYSISSYPSISLLMVTGGEFDQRWRVSEDVFRAVRLEVPVDRSDRYVRNLPEGKYQYEYDNLLVNYPSEGFTTVSYIDVLDGEADVDFFGKYVLIGCEYAPFEPYRQTPQGSWSPYRIHASALNTILRGTYVYRTPRLATVMILLVLSYGIFSFGMSDRRRHWKVVVVTLGVCGAAIGAAVMLFLLYRVWFDSSYVSLGAVVTGMITMSRR